LAITPHIADLRALSSEEVLKESAAAANTLFAGPGHLRLRPGGHTQNPKNIGSPWWPNVDGYVIPAQHALLYEEGRGMRIPVMAGTNTDEGASFLHHFPPQTVSEYNEYVTTTFAPCGLRIMAQYPAADPHAVPAAAQQLVTDAFFLYGAFSVARAQHGYLYRFSHAAGHGGGIVGHGAEMVYIFGHTRNYPALFDEADHRLADRMMTTWVHFARTGDPRLMESSDWTRIGSNGEVPYMDFGTTPTVKDLPDTSLRVFRDLWPPSGKPSQCSKR
jgi:carboxylesterase type B